MLSRFFKHTDPNEQSNKAIFMTLLAFALLGLLAAFILSVDKVRLLEDPSTELICSVNVFINCATVMQTWQASVVGPIPNSYFGILGFGAAVAFAIMLLSGAHKSTHRWVFVAAQVLYGAGMLFAYWLFYQSVYVIQVLCPWCLLVTFSTTILFEAMLRYNLRENMFNFSKDQHRKILGLLEKDYDKLITAAWVFFLVFLVLLQFREGLFG